MPTSGKTFFSGEFRVLASVTKTLLKVQKEYTVAGVWLKSVQCPSVFRAEPPLALHFQFQTTKLPTDDFHLLYTVYGFTWGYRVCHWSFISSNTNTQIFYVFCALVCSFANLWVRGACILCWLRTFHDTVLQACHLFNFIQTTNPAVLLKSVMAQLGACPPPWRKRKLTTLSGCPSSKPWTLTFPPTRGRMCIFPVRLSFTEATIKQVPQRMTCRSAHLCSWVLPFLTLNTPFSKVRSCWSAFTGRSGRESPCTDVSANLQQSI